MNHTYVTVIRSFIQNSFIHSLFIMSKRKKNGKSNTLKQDIFFIFKRSPKKRYNAGQLKKKVHGKISIDAVEARLEQLESEGKIIKLSNEKYKLAIGQRIRAKVTAEGRVDMTQRGAAYIVCDDLEFDIHVAPRNIGSALHGDRVKVEYEESSRRQKPEGRIVEVLKRATESFIGTIHISEKFAFLTADSRRMPIDIYVPLKKTKGAKDGEKVIVQITEWHTDDKRSPSGRVTMVLGEAGSHDIEMKSILIQQGFNLEFPSAVIQQTDMMPTEITKQEVARRRDMREVVTFTIDPDTAKDFDDALSIQYLKNGHCEIGIHIADVSHYVEENTALDKEALKRSTSVYLVDRVLPMLPEKLSNELCSLRPNEDKLTFSAVFEFNKSDKIVNRWFGRTVTHSNRRFTYEEAQEVLEAGKGDYAEELKNLNRIAYKLRKQKFKKGAINFETPEVKFVLDEASRPIDVYTKVRKDAHLLIEDFMLLANREVATIFAKKKEGAPVPFVYRVHDAPDPEKVMEFARYAMQMGYKMEFDTPRQIAAAYTKLMEEAETNDGLKLLVPLAIRTMAKAIYTTENIGHYGLAFDNYTHFTSPIRRYADVLVHRILYENLDKPHRVDAEELEMKCKQISAQERKAMEAERESIKYKQAEYLKERIGKQFEGVISGVIERGIFVAITENQCEGLVRFDTIEEPIVLENRFVAKGQWSGDTYRMGQTVQIEIIDVNMERKEVDMKLV